MVEREHKRFDPTFRKMTLETGQLVSSHKLHIQVLDSQLYNLLKPTLASFPMVLSGKRTKVHTQFIASKCKLSSAGLLYVYCVAEYTRLI